MRNLPFSSNLPIHHLAACFNDVTNSYKFFWFLAILEHISETEERVISSNALLARMIAMVWYPINYFKMSFGKQDRLALIASQIKNDTSLDIDSKKNEVFTGVMGQLSHIFDTTIKDDVISLSRFVPYRFLSPWFTSELAGEKDHRKNALIQSLADKYFGEAHHASLYRFLTKPETSIEIQPDWYAYLRKHHAILTGFCLWHLVNYLQKRNPNVPNIAGKLFEPEQRDLSQARKFWRIVFDNLGSIACIYSHQAMNKHAFSLDHFLPWRFVTHDLLWNIIPTPKPVNSSKSDCLPDLRVYFDEFAALQYQAFQAVAALKKETLLEDYTMLFQKSDVHEIASLDVNAFRRVLNETIAPQWQIAKNMGFSPDWTYQPA